MRSALTGQRAHGETGVPGALLGSLPDEPARKAAISKFEVLVCLPMGPAVPLATKRTVFPTWAGLTQETQKAPRVPS